MNVRLKKTHAEKWKPLELLKISKLLLRIIILLSRFPRFFSVLLYVLRPLYAPTKETWLNKKVRYGLLTFGGGLQPAAVMKAYRHAAMAVLENFDEVMDAQKEGKPVVWVEWILNAELIHAFDVTAFCSAALNIFGNIDSRATPVHLIERAEEEGIPEEYCSAMKLDMGAYFLNQLPNPSILIAGSHPCDTNVSVNQTIDYLIDVPSFTLDIPYWRDPDSYEYLAKQVWDQIDFLERHLGKKMDWDKFRDQLERVNEINYYLMEICEMNKAKPCPGSLIDLNFAWIIREINLKSPHTVEMARLLYEAVKKNYEKKKGIVKNEKIRILLWFPPIAFFTYLFKWLEDTFGAVIVADFIGQVSTVHIDTSTPETMVRDFAITQMNLAMGRQCHGPVEFITDEMVRFINEYDVDCMIFTGHQGCKHGWAAAKIIKDICKERKLPALYLNIDIMDQRLLDEQGVKDEITQFFTDNGWA